MELKIKRFTDLNTRELYEILRVRSEIFVVEQNCIYQDMDDRDFSSLHLYFEDQGSVKAYLRVFEKTDEPGTLQIGRVLTRHHGNGLGGRLLKESMEYIRNTLAPQRVFLEAQCYAVGFYEREGFRICSEEFLEDGIPHVGMEWTGKYLGIDRELTGD